MTRLHELLWLILLLMFILCLPTNDLYNEHRGMNDWIFNTALEEAE